MNRRDLYTELKTIAFVRLFRDRSWLDTDDETYFRYSEKLIQLGLQEKIPGTINTLKTDLGREMNLDLIEIFMGIRHEADIPYFLEENGFIDNSESESICKRIANRGGDTPAAEWVLKGYVQAAYYAYFDFGARK
jgi:hypothetical protein